MVRRWWGTAGGLAGEGDVEGDAVVGVGGGVGGVGDDGGVDLVVEVGADGDFARQDVVGGEVDVEAFAAAGGLGVAVVFDAADEGLVVVEADVGVDGEVVGDALARAFHFEDGVEADDFVSQAQFEAALVGLDDLSGRGVEGEGALLAPLGVDLEVVLEGDVDADEGSEALGDGYGRDVVGR